LNFIFEWLQIRDLSKNLNTSALSVPHTAPDTVASGYRHPRQLATFPDLVVAESTRQGGFSNSPYSSLNLGLYTKDQAGSIQQNRNQFFARLGCSEAEVAGMHQVHGSEVLRVNQPGQYPGYDALITNMTGLFLTVTVADCTPVLLYDPLHKAVAAIHAGWRGTVASIAAKALTAMQNDFGTDPTHCYAYVGTCIDECSFEVDADVADHFGAPFKRWDEGKKKFFIDLKAANAQILNKQGIPMAQIECSPYSTVLHNEDYFSYRKEKGVCGRMLGLIGVKQ